MNSCPLPVQDHKDLYHIAYHIAHSFLRQLSNLPLETFKYDLYIRFYNLVHS